MAAPMPRDAPVTRAIRMLQTPVHDLLHQFIGRIGGINHVDRDGLVFGAGFDHFVPVTSQHQFSGGKLAFLQGDYSNRMILQVPEYFHIKNVAKLFMDLITEK